MRKKTTLHTIDTKDPLFIQKAMTAYGLNEINKQIDSHVQNNQAILLTVMSIFLGAFMGFAISIGNTLLTLVGAIPLLIVIILHELKFKKNISNLLHQQTKVELQGKRIGLKL